MSLLHDYLAELYAIHASSAGVKETSYYPAVSSLFNTVGKTLKPSVRCIINLKNTGAGIPDGGFFTPDQFGQVADSGLTPTLLPARGVLEVKGTGEALAKIAASEQVDKYLAKYGQVLVTNLRGFLLVGRDEHGAKCLGEEFLLASTEAAFWALAASPGTAKAGQAASLAEYLQRVLLQAAPLASPEDVAWFLASYARDAASRVALSPLPALASVRAALEEALGLRFQGEKGDHFFRSTLVQTLFYGIFSAWVLWCRQHAVAKTAGRFDWRMAAWELHVPMIRALFEQLATPSKLGALGLVEVLDWTGAALNRVDQVAFFAKFDGEQAVQYFYEPFLQAFDPELRRELGVWYTPPEIVRYMVARVDTVLQEELGIADGLADPNVFVLDPCCGTGAYLVEVLRHIHARLDAAGDGLAASDLKKAATERVFGFEILPAPFVVAHLQLGLLLQNAGAPLSEAKAERVGVYLTNALTGWGTDDKPQPVLPIPEFGQERDLADQVKQKKPILVILGNPPYNAFSGTSPAEEEGLVEPYKHGLVSEWGIKKFNLDDLYVRFFRLAERRIAAETGIVCYISNFSYLSDPSFVVMRQRFLQEFDTLWFDSLNGDSRETGKQTPDGKPDPSIFSTQYNREGIRVGTAIGLMVRKKKREAASTVHFRQFWGTTKRADLLESLDAPHVSASYLPANPTKGNRFSFRPLGANTSYYSWPRLVELSEVSTIPGMAEDRKKSLIQTTSAELVSLMTDYYDKSFSWSGFCLKYPASGLIKDASRFVAKDARSKIQNNESFDATKIVRFNHHPFDVRFAYVSYQRPLWSEPIPSMRPHFWHGNRFLLSRMNCQASPEGVPIFFTKNLFDRQFSNRNPQAIPLFLQASFGREGVQEQLFVQDTIEEPKANLSPAARAYLASLGIADPDADAETAGLLWMHALAVGYSPAYLSENADGIRSDWPRVPLPATAEALHACAALGRQVAALLDTETPVPGVTHGTLAPEFRTLGVIGRVDGSPLQLDGGDLRITAGWGHAGQGGVTMPGRGKTAERPYTAAEAEALGDRWAQLGETTRDVYLNGVACWRNVPARVWEYTLGGYQVMKKWLSYREYALLGRDLTPDEAREVSAMTRRLAALRGLEPALDESYEAAKTAAFAWPP